MVNRTGERQAEPAEQRAEPAAESGRSLSPAVTRAAAVLDLLAERRGSALGLAEIARSLGLAKSSVSNICGALVDAGLLRRLPEGYVLGHRLVAYAEAYLSGVDVVREFHDACRDSPGADGETVQLAVLSAVSAEVVYLARRDGRHPVVLASQVGRPLPATTTATGKALLAELGPEELRARLGAGALPVLTPRSLTDPAALAEELGRIRERGYAVDDGETLEGLFCIAATVPGTAQRGQPAAVSFTGLAAAAGDTEARAARLRALAAGLGARMGGAPAPR
ncbi:IclR family transcriptional regulator [Nocardiopsis coralliicola]